VAQTPSYVEHAVELVSSAGPARARRMMGGWMLYVGALPMALVWDERLYLKTDQETRQAFRDAGGEPFTFAQRGRTVETGYLTPPDAALDDPESMLPWARLAVEAAKRARARKGSRSGSGSGSRSDSRSRSRSRPK
jgi:DNA transformation protein